MTQTARRVLVVLQYPDYLRLFGDAITALRERGFDIVLAFDKPGKNEEALKRAAALGRVEWTTWSPGERQRLLEEFGCALDYMRFMTPEFAAKRYLRQRMDKYLPARFAALRGRPVLPASLVTCAHATTRALEAATPGDEGHREWLARLRPDAIVVSPVILRGRGSARQTELVKTARRMGIPVAIAVGSWDHLSSKGLLRVQPDRLLVWNDVQRDEAIRYHRVAPSSVVVTGAYPWQCWLDMTPTQRREEFLAHVGLPPGEPYVLYVGSSRGIATPDAELRFVREWIGALRAARQPELQRTAILIRPHPANREHWHPAALDGLGPVAVWPTGERPVYMREHDRQAYYHSIYYGEAVVGINTSAMIEATIIGRPVLSIRQPYVAQAETVHFEYMTPESGGSTVVADSFGEHVEQLAETLRDPQRLAPARERFVRSFVKPEAGSRMPLDVLGDAVEELTRLPRRPRHVPVWLRPLGALTRLAARRFSSDVSSSRVQLRNPGARV